MIQLLNVIIIYFWIKNQREYLSGIPIRDRENYREHKYLSKHEFINIMNKRFPKTDRRKYSKYYSQYIVRNIMIKYVKVSFKKIS